MAIYMVGFTSEVQAVVPVEADSEQEAMDRFNAGDVSFEDMIEQSSDTGEAEFAELSED